MKQVLIHCKPESLSDLIKEGLNYSYNPKMDEYDVLVNDIETDPNDQYDDPDKQLCDYYNIDYWNHVNCVEMAWCRGSNPFNTLGYLLT